MKNLFDRLFFKEGLAGVWKKKIFPLGRVGAILLAGLIMVIVYFPLKGLIIIGKFIWEKRWPVWENTMVVVKCLMGFILLIGILLTSIVTVLYSAIVFPFAFLISGSKGINKLRELLCDDTCPFLWNMKSQWPSIKQFPLSGVSILSGVFLVSFVFTGILPAWISIFVFFLGMTLAYAGIIKSSENGYEPSEAL